MKQDEYIKQRVQDQIDWHDRKSQWNQRWFKRIQVVIIAAGALVPFMTGLWSEPSLYQQLVVGGLGVIVVVASGILTLYRFQELWVDYRMTAESLRSEKLFFETGVSPYDVDDAFPLLVGKVEALLNRQNVQWQERQQQGSTATGKS
jgi:hypothetical protein